MRKIFTLALVALMSLGAFAADYPGVPAGTYDVGGAENPGGGKKFSSYPQAGMYLWQAPSGHSYSKGSGQWTGIYTIYSESGIVFHNAATADVTAVLDAGSVAADENVSAMPSILVATSRTS